MQHSEHNIWGSLVKQAHIMNTIRVNTIILLLKKKVALLSPVISFFHLFRLIHILFFCFPVPSLDQLHSFACCFFTSFELPVADHLFRHSLTNSLVSQLVYNSFALYFLAAVSLFPNQFFHSISCSYILISFSDWLLVLLFSRILSRSRARPAYKWLGSTNFQPVSLLTSCTRSYKYLYVIGNINFNHRCSDSGSLWYFRMIFTGGELWCSTTQAIYNHLNFQSWPQLGRR